MDPITSHRFSRRTMLGTALAAGALAAVAPPTALPTLHAHGASTRNAFDLGQDPNAERGTLVSSSAEASLDAGEVRAYLDQFGLDTSRAEADIDAARIVYRTVDPAGESIVASGLVVLPTAGDAEPQVVAWLHGTTAYRFATASVSSESPDRAIAFALASAGYAVSAPDYLGLGLGPGFHPYNHIDSTVTASIDALRATHALAERADRRLGERVLASGFSQGGPAAMALGRALQDGADSRLRLAALAPISGPLDFSGTVQVALDGEIEAGPLYLAYLVVAWNRLHHLYDAPGDAFLPPFDRTVETLLDGYHTNEEVFAGLPVAAPAELFTPRFLDLLRHPTGPWREALRLADGTCDWRPDIPVQLYAASGDRDVPIANAHHALETLQARGVDATVHDVGDVDHGGSVILAMPRVLDQFDAVSGA